MDISNTKPGVLGNIWGERRMFALVTGEPLGFKVIIPPSCGITNATNATKPASGESTSTLRSLRMPHRFFLMARIVQRSPVQYGGGSYLPFYRDKMGALTPKVYIFQWGWTPLNKCFEVGCTPSLNLSLEGMCSIKWQALRLQYSVLMCFVLCVLNTF